MSKDAVYIVGYKVKEADALQYLQKYFDLRTKDGCKRTRVDLPSAICNDTRSGVEVNVNGHGFIWIYDKQFETKYFFMTIGTPFPSMFDEGEKQVENYKIKLSTLKATLKEEGVEIQEQVEKIYMIYT